MRSQNALAHLYSVGQGVHQDVERAVELWEKAAVQVGVCMAPTIAIIAIVIVIA